MSAARCRLGVAAVVLGVLTMFFATGVAAAKPVVPDTKAITLSTRKDDAGPHPVLRWKPVGGAAQYVVVVQTPKADPYWIWQGPETRVRFGGGPLDADDATEGAELVGTKVWFVLAYDDGGTLVASSAKRPISR